MSAELKVVLVGDNPEQQKAFNDPQSVSQSQQAAPPVKSSSDTEEAGQASRAKSLLDSPEVGSVQDLTDAIQKLVEQMVREQDRQKTAPDGNEQQKTQGMLDRIGRSLQSALNRTGLPNTRIGKRIGAAVTSASRRASQLGKAFAKTRVGAGLARAGGAIAARLGLGAAGASAGAGAGAAGGAAAGAAAGAAGALGAIAVPATLVAAALTAAAASVKAFSDYMHSVADELERFSPAIAVERSMFEASRQFSTLDRAARVGPEIANLEAARFRIQESMYEVQTKLLEIAVKATPLVEGILNLTDQTVQHVGNGLPHIIAASELLLGTIAPTIGAGVEAAKLANEMQKKRDDEAKKKKEEEEQLIDPFFQQLMQLEAGGKKPRGNDVMVRNFP